SGRPSSGQAPWRPSGSKERPHDVHSRWVRKDGITSHSTLRCPTPPPAPPLQGKGCDSSARQLSERAAGSDTPLLAGEGLGEGKTAARARFGRSSFWKRLRM